MNNLNKKHFIASLVGHMLALVLFLLLNTDNKIHRHFLVLGAHSKKPTHAYFKPLKAPPTTNWLSARNKPSRIKSKRKSSKKQSKIKIKKKITKQSKKKKPTKSIKQKKKKSGKATIKKEKKPKQSKIKKLKEKRTKQRKKEKEAKKPSHEPAKEEQNIEPETPKTPSSKQPVQDKSEELHFNLLGENDPSLVIYQKHIQKEVQRLWHPPVGVPRGTECSASFLINSKGKVEKFEFVNRSKILIYDLSVSRIAKNFNFEKNLWNKRIIIDFRQ